MNIPLKTWMKYKDKLAAIDRRAEVEMISFVQSIGGYGDHVNECLDYAFALATKYGEAAGAAACELYEAVAAASGITLEAMPAATATYEEVAKSLNGIHKISNDPAKLSQGVSRLVKRTAADTTLQNAVRDGAYFAWVPSGDTCAFCLMLASNGWRKAGKKTLKGDHAEHIHANCDCQYAVTFDPLSGVEGYDPAEYEAIFDGIDGDWNKKINVVRQRQYAENKDYINAKKKVAYDKRTEFRSVYDQYKRSAKPGEGDYVAPDSRIFKNREKENMDLLYGTFGGDIEALGEKPGQKNPDYRWRGHFWEEKEPSYTKNAVDKNVQKAIHQIEKDPGGIVLDVGNSDMSKESVEAILRERLRGSARFNCDIVVIRNGEIEEVYRYKNIKK